MRRVGHAAAVNGDNAGVHLACRCARHVARHLALGLGQQPVPHAHFFLGAHNVNGGGHDVGTGFAVFVGGLFGGLTAHQFGLAHVLRLIAQHSTRHRVLQRRGIAKHAVIWQLSLAFNDLAIRRAARIGTVAPAEQHAAFLGGHDARCSGKAAVINNDGLGQEWLNQLAA